MRRHDPERAAAAFLGGELTAAEVERFERHLLDCEQCWKEVSLASLGRRVAEGGRELAPPELRDRVRAAVELAPVRQPRRSARPTALLVMLAVVSATVTVPALLGGRDQPEPIQAILADFGGAVPLPRPAPPDLPPRLGDLRLTAAATGWAEGLAVTAHRYRDEAGHRVVVYRADRAFPEATGARAHPSGSTWEARAGHVTLFCADRPFHALVVGDDVREVRLAVRTLGLR